MIMAKVIEFTADDTINGVLYKKGTIQSISDSLYESKVNGEKPTAKLYIEKKASKAKE
jgi:hypothetical protein